MDFDEIVNSPRLIRDWDDVNEARRRSVRATTESIFKVHRDYGLLSEREADRVLGGTGLAARYRDLGALLAIEARGQFYFPGYQFLPDGTINPLIGLLRKSAAATDWTEYDIFMWLPRRNGRLRGRLAPIVAWRDPALRDEVLNAADIDMFGQW